MTHDQFCNCEDCWWARGQREVCTVCGAVHEADAAPEHKRYEANDADFGWVEVTVVNDIPDSNGDIIINRGCGDVLFPAELVREQPIEGVSDAIHVR